MIVGYASSLGPSESASPSPDTAMLPSSCISHICPVLEAQVLRNLHFTSPPDARITLITSCSPTRDIWVVHAIQSLSDSRSQLMSGSAENVLAATRQLLERSSLAVDAFIGTNGFGYPPTEQLGSVRDSSDSEVDSIPSGATHASSISSEIVSIRLKEPRMAKDRSGPKETSTSISMVSHRSKQKQKPAARGVTFRAPSPGSDHSGQSDSDNESNQTTLAGGTHVSPIESHQISPFIPSFGNRYGFPSSETQHDHPPPPPPTAPVSSDYSSGWAPSDSYSMTSRNETGFPHAPAPPPPRPPPPPSPTDRPIQPSMPARVSLRQRPTDNFTPPRPFKAAGPFPLRLAISTRSLPNSPPPHCVVTMLPRPSLRYLLDVAVAHVRASPDFLKLFPPARLSASAKRVEVEGTLCDMTNYAYDDLSVFFAKGSGMPLFEVEIEVEDMLSECGP